MSSVFCGGPTVHVGERGEDSTDTVDDLQVTRWVQPSVEDANDQNTLFVLSVEDDMRSVLEAP